jgi:hypothetical protein
MPCTKEDRDFFVSQTILSIDTQITQILHINLICMYILSFVGMKKNLGQGFFLIFIEHNYEEKKKVGFMLTVMLVTFEGHHQ